MVVTEPCRHSRRRCRGLRSLGRAPRGDAPRHLLGESKQIAETAALDDLVKGARYEAAVREKLDVNQLPKPFQVNALASRDWQLASEWHRFSFTP